jgi:chloramphenicol-sensitive protein RarD
MQSPSEVRSGLMAAITAYVLWGFLPLYFKVLGDTAPATVLAHRIIWSAPTALILIAMAGKLGDLIKAVRTPRVLWALLLSAFAIAANWTIYIWAVMHGHVLEGSLGYFINPLVTFLFAGLMFGERFRPLQLVAVAIATAGVVNQAVVVGQFPWISLALAVSFAIYGVIRKRVAVDSRVGFGIEAAWLAPVALLYLLFFHPASQIAFPADPGRMALLVAAGPLTAAPLILFAFGARRLRLSTIGILQYIGPSIQFVIGLLLGEAFTPGHAVTFGLIWLGVAVFTFSGLRADRKLHTPSPAPALAD